MPYSIASVFQRIDIRYNRFVSLFLAIVVGGCATSAKLKDSPIKWKTIDNSTYPSEMESAKTIIVQDQITWFNIWALHTANLPNRPLPSVDFSQKTVVGIALGVKPDGCYTVRIDKVHRNPGVTEVHYTEMIPGPASICTYGRTTPTHFIAIPKVVGPIEFHRR